VPYSVDEFIEAYPASSNPLRATIQTAIAHPGRIFQEYFGEDYQKRLLDEFKNVIVMDYRNQLVIPSPLATRLAASLAFIRFCAIPDQLLASYLRRNAEAQVVAVAGAY
jgi:hypothetical protein